MDNLITAIRRQLQVKMTDLGWPPHAQLKTANALEVAEDEKQLGFALPPLLKRMYTEIGNGGFGPGYGLIGLTNGVPDDLGKTALDIYKGFRGMDRTDPAWNWPYGLLPVCHWGCAILSCIDCADPDFPMRIFDPNVHQGDDWADSFFEESSGFELWIGAWAQGADLWELSYGESGHVAQILSTRDQIH